MSKVRLGLVRSPYFIMGTTILQAEQVAIQWFEIPSDRLSALRSYSVMFYFKPFVCTCSWFLFLQDSTTTTPFYVLSVTSFWPGVLLKSSASTTVSGRLRIFSGCINQRVVFFFFYIYYYSCHFRITGRNPVKSRENENIYVFLLWTCE